MNIVKPIDWHDGKPAFVDWGRHWRIPGHHGGAVVYTGEDAEIIALLLKYQEKEGGNS